MRINWARKRWWEVNKPISKWTRESFLRPARHSAKSSQWGTSLPVRTIPPAAARPLLRKHWERTGFSLAICNAMLFWLNLPLDDLSVHFLLTCFKRWSSGRRVGAINSSLVCSYHWVPFTNRRVTIYYTVKGKVQKTFTTACFPFPGGWRQTLNSIKPPLILKSDGTTVYDPWQSPHRCPGLRARASPASSTAPLPLQEASGLLHTVFSARNVPGSAGTPQSRHRVYHDGLPTTRSVDKSTCQLPPPHTNLQLSQATLTESKPDSSVTDIP